jgi:lipoate-protein ligase A
MARLLVLRLAPGPAEAYLGAAQSVLARDEGDPVLLLAPLAGETALLGRHQRAASALRLPLAHQRGLPVARRLGGGRALLAGEGALAVLAAAPPGASLFPGPFGADKVLNRYVRGLLAGLRASGARAAAWFGRDFVSSDSRRVAVVSQEGSAAGGTALEAVVAVSRDLALPEELAGYPAHGDPRAGGPPPATLAETAGRPVAAGEVVEALARGFASAAGLEPVSWEVPAGTPARDPPPGEEPETGLASSGLAEIPIGFAEALARREGDRIGEARIRGDFIAPSFALEALERSLAGCPATFAEVGRRVDQAFRVPGASILGLRDLRVLAEAVLAAVGEPGESG